MDRMGVFLALLAAITSGCAVAHGPLFSVAPAPDKGQGTFYIYREEAAFAYTPTVKINDVPFVQLAHNGYSYAYLTPGIYKLTVAYTFVAVTAPLVTEFAITDGQVIFMRLTDSGYSRILYDMPGEKAMEEIKDHRYVEPLNTVF